MDIESNIYQTDICIFCYDDIKTHPIIILPCRHLFHNQCFMIYFDYTISNHKDVSCPLCNQLYCRRTELIKINLVSFTFIFCVGLIIFSIFYKTILYIETYKETSLSVL